MNVRPAISQEMLISQRCFAICPRMNFFRQNLRRNSSVNSSSMQAGMESVMNWQQQAWYRAGGDIVARAGFSLAMCGALAGLLYLSAGDGAQDTASAKAPQAATILASFDSTAGLSKLPAVSDASIAAVPAIAQIQPAVERLADIGPIPAKRPLTPIKKASKEPVAVVSNVARFESCLPSCETRDPLIVGSTQKSAEAEVSPLPTDEMVQEVSFADEKPSILGRALDAPGLVYRTGRHALTTLVRAAL